MIGRQPNEHVTGLYLNARHQITHCRTIHVGTITACLVDPRDVYQTALLTNAAAIILGHNHPSGDVTPSTHDYLAYRTLKAGGETLGVPLLDFIVVSPSGEYYSFSEQSEL